MQESFNKVTLVGKVSEITYRKDVNRNKDNYVAGEIKIETGEDNIIPVSFYQNELTKDGKPNGIYASLMTVIDEFKTIAKDGREAADTVSVTTGKLEENSFYGKDGNLIRQYRISSPFFNRKSGAEPANEFVVEGIVVNTSDEIKNDVPTGRLFVDLLVIGYGDRGNILRLVVEGEKGVDYIKSSVSERDEVKFAGQVLHSEINEQVKEEVAFGEPIIRITTRTEKKLLITSATAARESTASSEEIDTILADREGRLKVAKERAESKAKKEETKTTSTRGNFSL